MDGRRFARTTLLGVLAGAAGLTAWLMATGPRALLEPARPPDTVATTMLEDLRTPELAALPARDAVTAKLEELGALSETFRNTTFLIAIRDAGFTCHTVASVYGGLNDSTTWTVACQDMLAYSVRVDERGQLVIEPTLHVLDAPLPPRAEPRRDLPAPLR